MYKLFMQIRYDRNGCGREWSDFQLIPSSLNYWFEIHFSFFRGSCSFHSLDSTSWLMGVRINRRKHREIVFSSVSNVCQTNCGFADEHWPVCVHWIDFKLVKVFTYFHCGEIPNSISAEVTGANTQRCRYLAGSDIFYPKHCRYLQSVRSLYTLFTVILCYVQLTQFHIHLYGCWRREEMEKTLMRKWAHTHTVSMPWTKL